MLSENRNAMELAPWTVLFPGLTLGVLVLSINMFGDAIDIHGDAKTSGVANADQGDELVEQCKLLCERHDALRTRPQ